MQCLGLCLKLHCSICKLNFGTEDTHCRLNSNDHWRLTMYHYDRNIPARFIIIFTMLLKSGAFWNKEWSRTSGWNWYKMYADLCVRYQQWNESLENWKQKWKWRFVWVTCLICHALPKLKIQHWDHNKSVAQALWLPSAWHCVMALL